MFVYILIFILGVRHRIVTTQVTPVMRMPSQVHPMSAVHSPQRLPHTPASIPGNYQLNGSQRPMLHSGYGQYIILPFDVC